ncbi:hypothetical protein [Sphingobacterium siyangense]|uniref:hypothetical protein n=1 Tax=Sphingobacterium siyangense TaxID=459529 RepID=UPI00196323CE|nr:hypothetical protein [Sphingobacterium siyangense]QRY55505.1 hypothetical protein JVX97_15805 [Sphingobacterium siyangense]
MDFNTLIQPNAVVEGLDKTYHAWEFRQHAIMFLPVKGLVCIASRMMLPKRIKYIYIGYHADMIEFLRLDIGGVHSYIFIAASDLRDAKKIMRDVRRKHPELKQLSK